MARSLQNLSLAALLHPLWDGYGHNPESTYCTGLESCWSKIALDFGLKIHKFGLPLSVENELKLALLEFAKRKCVKTRLRMELLPMERPSCCDRAMREFLPPYYWAEPLDITTTTGRRRISAPSLLRYFPNVDDHMTILNLLFALIRTNPRNDASPIRQVWTRKTFRPMQSIFLDNFAGIWIGVLGDVRNTLLLEGDERDALNSLEYSMNPLMCTHLGNETLPWFVFELLDDNQRDGFLALGRTELLERSSFRCFFSTIFKHWPWQNAAFDRYFAGRVTFSKCEMFVLRHVRNHHWDKEHRAVDAGMLSEEASFFIKLDRFMERIRVINNVT